MHPRRYLCPLAHFKESTDWVERSCATDVQVGLVVGLKDPDEVLALFLERQGDNGHLNCKTMHLLFILIREMHV